MMPEVVVENLASKTIHCESNSERLLDILLSATDWMNACGGKGKCTTCTAIVLSGADNLSEMTLAEKTFANLGRLKPNERLSCQVRVAGDLKIKAPDQYKLPHLSYSI